MLKRLIIFLVRKRLGLKKYETFQFANQRDEFNYYWFNDTELRKYVSKEGIAVDAHVSLNWILHDECEILTCDPETMFAEEE